MILPDVNVLIYAHRKDTPRHSQYHSWLESLCSGQARFGLSELVLSGFIRIATHPRIFREPTSLEIAFQFVEDLRGNRNAEIVSPGPRHWSIFADLCRQLRVKGSAISDVYHAALAIEVNAEWISEDKAFSRYPGLRWRSLFD